MASMYRNTNLEEIEVDSFLGIDFLKYQTLPQQIIFVAVFVCGGAMLLVATLIFKLNPMLSLLCGLPFLLISILFGCNYNQDLSLFKYLMLLLVEPVKTFSNEPTEDIHYIRKKAKEYDNETEISSDEVNEEEQKRLLRRFIIGIIAFVIILVIMLVFITLMKDDGGLHHTIS